MKTPHALLSELLHTPPAPYVASSFFTPKSQQPAPPSAALCVMKIKPAGDVIHVFSHIRKTYRVQWVVLEGGGNEPPLLSPRVQQANKLAGAGHKAGGQLGKAASDATGSPSVAAKWIPIDHVTDAKQVPLLTIFQRSIDGSCLALGLVQSKFLIKSRRFGKEDLRCDLI
jgi:A/G-specific adenine glycosylase